MKIANVVPSILEAAAILALGACCSDSSECPDFQGAARPTPKALTLDADTTAAVSSINEGFAKVVEYMKTTDLSKLAPGRYDIDGDRVYVKIGKCAYPPKRESSLEVHRKYADLQYVISGYEIIAVRDAAECKYLGTPYSPETDLMFFFDTPSENVELKEGQFIVLLPGDGHAFPVDDRAGAVPESCTLRTAVFKIKMPD